MPKRSTPTSQHILDTHAFDMWWNKQFPPFDAVVKYAKVEAILASALASVEADAQSFPSLDWLTESGIRQVEVLKKACRQLLNAGAHPYVLERLITFATEDPMARRGLAMVHQGLSRLAHMREQLKTLPRKIMCLQSWIVDPVFADLSPALQDQLRSELDEAQAEYQRLQRQKADASRRADTADPLLTLMDRDASMTSTDPTMTIAQFIPGLERSKRPRRGRPSWDAAELCMTILSDHLYAHTGVRGKHDEPIGYFAQALFPGSLTPKPKAFQPPERLVRDRRRKFMKQYRDQYTTLCQTLFPTGLPF
jgi:hypothetical protein